MTPRGYLRRHNAMRKASKTRLSAIRSLIAQAKTLRGAVVKAKLFSGPADADTLCRRKRFIFVGLRMPRTGLLHHLRLACHESHRCSESLDGDPLASGKIRQLKLIGIGRSRMHESCAGSWCTLLPTLRANPSSKLSFTGSPDADPSPSIEATECNLARSRNQWGKNVLTHFPPHKQKIQSPLSDWIF